MGRCSDTDTDPELQGISSSSCLKYVVEMF